MATNSTVAVARRQAQGIFHAVRFAKDNGRALNLLVSINFSLLDISDEDAGPIFRSLWHSRSIGRAARVRAGWRRKNQAA